MTVFDFSSIGGHAMTYFMGMDMLCCMCGKLQKSHPRIVSKWTVVEVDGKPFYVCPDHLPGKGGTTEEFSLAYQKILTKINAILAGVPNAN